LVALFAQRLTTRGGTSEEAASSSRRATEEAGSWRGRASEKAAASRPRRATEEAGGRRVRAETETGSWRRRRASEDAASCSRLRSYLQLKHLQLVRSWVSKQFVDGLQLPFSQKLARLLCHNFALS